MYNKTEWQSMDCSLRRAEAVLKNCIGKERESCTSIAAFISGSFSSSSGMLLMTRRLFTLFLGPSATTTSVVQLGLLQLGLLQLGLLQLGLLQLGLLQLGLLQLGLLPVTPEEGVSVSIQHMLGAILLVPH